MSNHSRRSSIAAAAASLLLLLSGSVFADLKIMPLGDSNTGIDPSEFPEPHTGPAFENMSKYRGPLYQMLTAAGYDVNFVGTENSGDASLPDRDHEGHGGYRIKQLTRGSSENGVNGMGDWLDALAAAGQTPDIVLVMAGTNNMLQTAAYRTAAPGDLEELVDLLIARLPAARIIVASIPPLYIKNQPQYNDYVNAFNAKIWNADPDNLGIVNVRQAAGKNVEFVDLNAVLGPSGMASDGIHMNAAGYEAAAGAFYNAIAVPEPATALLVLGVAAPLLARRRP